MNERIDMNNKSDALLIYDVKNNEWYWLDKNGQKEKANDIK